MSKVDESYWKCEYENLRRKDKKKIERMLLQMSIFTHKTWDLLKLLGMSEDEILNYYRENDTNKSKLHETTNL